MKNISQVFLLLQKSYYNLSSQRVFIVWITLLISFLFLFLTLVSINNKIVITIPKRGGKLSEGIVGTPRFINPVLATNSQDETLTSLVFAGLTKIDETNTAVLDMASSIDKNENGLTYTVTLKDNLYFHDGQKVTTDDILFTIALIQNPNLKSPLRLKWEGVKVEKLSNSKILFTLRQEYPLFERSLSLGILPKHIWKNLSIEEIPLSDQNIHAIGSGPYIIESTEQVSGIPRVFNLKEYKHYSLGRPYTEGITIHSYQNEKLLEQAFTAKEIQNFAVVSHTNMKDLSANDIQKNTMTLPQTFSIFFNPNKASFLADKDIRKALDITLHKEALVHSLFADGAVAATSHSPFLERKGEEVTEDPRDLIRKSAYMKRNASSTLHITLTIGDSDDNRQLANAIKEKWGALGVLTTIQIFEFSDLNIRVIKPRDFEAVLSGTLIEDESGLYAFWHSSQRAYPGLNIANYASSKMDENLEALRIESDEARRAELVNLIEDELRDETPAIFLYHPKLLYFSKKPLITSFPSHGINESSRFSGIQKWYKQTEKVWKFSYKQKAMTLIEEILH